MLRTNGKSLSHRNLLQESVLFSTLAIVLINIPSLISAAQNLFLLISATIT